MRTLFVTAESSPYTRFRRALDSGNLDWVRTAALELPQVQLGDALRIVYVMRDDEALFERAAIRWLGRFCLEAPDPSLAEVEAAAGALRRVAWHPEEAGDALAEICRHAGINY
jgi:hypothetical protein